MSPLSFERDIKPLFRARDRGSMLSTFDGLWVVVPSPIRAFGERAAAA
jgi:hypothetical protein